MKSYWKWQFKNAIPFMIVVFSLMTIIPLISVLSLSPYETFYATESGYIGYSAISPSVLLLENLIPALIAISIAPFVVYSYRYSLRSVDTFYQASRKEGYAKRTRSFIYAGIVLASFTIIFWLSVLGVFLKIKYGRIPENNEYAIYARVQYDFIWYLPAYFMSLVALILQFGIASFFISKGNSLLRSIFNLVLGECFLGFIFLGLFIYIETIVVCCQLGEGAMVSVDGLFASVGTARGGGYLTHNASIALPAAFIYQLFKDRIAMNTVSPLFVFNDSMAFFSSITIIFLIIYMAFGIFGLVLIFKEKEPSGEYAGKTNSPNILPDVIFHAGMGTIGLLEFSCSLLSLISLITGFISFGVIYFANGRVLSKFQMEQETISPLFHCTW